MKENAASGASRAMGKNLDEAGYPRPTDGFEAHHIVAAGDPKAAQAQAQQQLQRPRRAPERRRQRRWLPGPTLKDKVPPPSEPFHRPIHTGFYCEQVAFDLRRATKPTKRARFCATSGNRSMPLGRAYITCLFVRRVREAGLRGLDLNNPVWTADDGTVGCA